ncbi:Conserved oligomeric Golgi complex subunit 5 [Hanseniaspora osmophila]|uniref:Conserved oligomeric Golgi complex subunit 5 n=1 Tax=Hanseniaspora osmophila TaxID=56408 RepID=A0A1E5RNI5_9ASCO|nr:Conserved oligomeric Golgi complex subunit 5 [Hanseniaspora osmophila]
MTNLNQDFEEYLEESFNYIQFSNSFLKATNQSSKNTIDFKTPIKKITYDLEEIESRLETCVKSNYQLLISQLQETDNNSQHLQKALVPNLDYIELSYNRLNNHVLGPYERATKLQLALNKIHQTNTLLRSFLNFSSLILQAQTFDIQKILVQEIDFKKSATHDLVLKISNLTIVHQQIELGLSSDDLSKIQLVQQANTDFVSPQKLLLVKRVNELVIKLMELNYTQISGLQEQLLSLISSLYALSPSQLFVTIDNIIKSKSSLSTQILSKSITSIKDFKSNLESCTGSHMKTIIFFENQILKACNGSDKGIAASDGNLTSLGAPLSMSRSSKTFSSSGSTFMNSSNALSKFLHYYNKANTDVRASTLLFIFWQQIAKMFQHEFEINMKRGGPVGKTLVQSQSTISNTFEKVLSQEVPDYYSDKGDIIALMKSTVSGSKTV